MPDAPRHPRTPLVSSAWDRRAWLIFAGLVSALVIGVVFEVTGILLLWVVAATPVVIRMIVGSSRSKHALADPGPLASLQILVCLVGIAALVTLTFHGIHFVLCPWNITVNWKVATGAIDIVAGAILGVIVAIWLIRVTNTQDEP